ncbi:MAG: 3-deoxy-manno-octulosonate cytidylyltransferase [Deltaproteobacteria bacterium]|nr:3-deoxy-manno-octulosonate cytidylyltransferase [Deltaproteobacteria bacterium]
MDKIVAVIPARMASSRFPGKPLKPILGLSMVEHVRRRVSLCPQVNKVIVATCDREIVEEVERFGGEAVMTSDRHEHCSDRVAEVAEVLDAEIIINVQGDMPLIRPETLEPLVAPLVQDKDLVCTDMMGAIEDDSEFINPNVVKVVVDTSKYALYYSREPIPSLKKAPSGYDMPRYKQFGVIAFRRDFLIKFAGLPKTPLERIESVDMLRALEHGYKIRMVSTLYPVVGVDTQEDLELATEFMKKDPLLSRYN